MGGTFTNLQYHIVFSTKNRRPFISDTVRPRLYDYIGGTIRRQEAVLYEIGGTADHVHLLLRWRPDGSISDLVRDIKSASSGWMHKTIPGMSAFYWQDGFGAFTVSHSQSDKLKAYMNGAVGVGGHPRTLGGRGDGQVVGAAIARALRRISQVHPQLHAHLVASIKSPYSDAIRYEPPEPTSWDVVM